MEAAKHGGDFWKSIGTTFDDLSRRHEVIAADVLDAWFPPAPEIVELCSQHLGWLMQTSPPTHCEGLVDTIARTRNVPRECITPGPGSSSLIFAGLRRIFSRDMVALVPDPTYGEYAHVLGNILNGTVRRFELQESEGLAISVDRLIEASRGASLVVLVNPNSPTGLLTQRGEIERLIEALPSETWIWIDETYIDYAGSENSVESFVATHPNLIVSKSLSKVYALSGLRVGYLVASESVTREIQRNSPPWAVDLVAQVAAVKALEDVNYYPARWRETAQLRAVLSSGLESLGYRVLPSSANFLFAFSDAAEESVAVTLARCQREGLFLRKFDEGRPDLRERVLRVAVKDAQTQARMMQILAGRA